ncbi:MAG: TetR/AcrR family transcriptional regulator [Acidimicrobiaceae bacterium]|nr:TetR/AcrR family transcriptional regulator [Acidimicrobiaceae bacterium]MYF43957.1 TetR/AcrR family transcriptional regulator [Acidimicrobiaceae bacterium]MYJ34975.1 TetR/AcrR family transcriptional regulator [Acidimicrobiaceae bacterium]
MAASGEPRRRGDSEQTARRVVEAAAAEFVERGYDGAVISDIARRAGVTPGAIYPRWPHKSDLMAAAVDHLLEQLQPERRLQDLGLAELTVPEIFAAWGMYLLTSDSVKEPLNQVFGSARNNVEIQQILQSFLDEQAEQLHGLVERAKDEGSFDPEHDTASIALMIQAIGIGTHLVLSAGLADRHKPSEQDWTALLTEVIARLAPQTPPDQ